MDKEYFGRWCGFFEKLCVIAVTFFGAQIAFWGTYYVNHGFISSSNLWLLSIGTISNVIFGWVMIWFFVLNLRKLRAVK